jgi:hypothetical protein
VLAYARGIYGKSDVYLLLGRPSLPLYEEQGLGIRSKSVIGDCKP